MLEPPFSEKGCEGLWPPVPGWDYMSFTCLPLGRVGSSQEEENGVLSPPWLLLLCSHNGHIRAGCPRQGATLGRVTAVSTGRGHWGRGLALLGSRCWSGGGGRGVPTGHKQHVHAGESKRKRFWVKGQSYLPASWARKMWPHLRLSWDPLDTAGPEKQGMAGTALSTLTDCPQP